MHPKINEEVPSSTPVFDREFTNTIWARLDTHPSGEIDGNECCITVAAEMPQSFVLPEGVSAFRHNVEFVDEQFNIDIYNDCVCVFTGDHFTPDQTERYRILRLEMLRDSPSPFPDEAVRRFIRKMRSVAVATFSTAFVNEEQFKLHGLSHYCARLMSACDRIVDAERGTFHKMAWTFPYHLSFLSIGIYWVHLLYSDGRESSNAFLGNSGRVALSTPFTSSASFDLVKAALTSEKAYPEWWSYFCKSATLLGQNSFRSAIIESVVALEMAISSFVRQRLSERGVSKSRLQNVKRDLTLSLMLNVELVSLAPDDAKPPADLVGRLNRARKLRNDIVHEGHTRVTEEQAREALQAVKDGLLYIAPFIWNQSLPFAGSENSEQ